MQTSARPAKMPRGRRFCMHQAVLSPPYGRQTVDKHKIYVKMILLCIDVAKALLSMQIYLAGRRRRLKLIGQGWPLPRAV